MIQMLGNEYKFTSWLWCRNPARVRLARPASNPDRALHVDWRLRALPHGREVAQGALSLSARRPACDHALRSLGGLHAGTPAGDRRRLAARAPAAWRAQGPRGAAAARGLWRRTDYASHLEGGARAVPRRHSREGRLGRRVAIWVGQRFASRRTQTAAHGRPMRRACVTGEGSCAGELASAGTQGSAGRGRRVARADGLAERWPAEP